MWNKKVFDPPIATDADVWLGTRASTPSPLPTRRATVIVCPEVLLKVMIEIGSSTPAALLWSLQVAVRLTRPLNEDTSCGAPGALSATSKLRLKDPLFATSATNLPGRRPLSMPLRLVATSFPAACESVEPAETALLPSTEPAREA